MSFALITGASRGIGKALAFQFAQKGKPVLLVARDLQMLKEVSSEIELTYRIRAPYLAVDLSEKDAPQKIFDWSDKSGYVIDVLVNNAGYGLGGPFDEHPIQDWLNMMEVNMTALVKLTWLFLPELKTKDRAYILNIGSSAGYQSTPFMSLYSATKAFVINFSRGLHFELKGSNVSVTCISPGSTKTNFNERAQLNQKAKDMAKKVEMSADAVAKVAIRAMYKRRTEVIVGVINKPVDVQA